jgi:hypothetical protein
MHYSSLHSPLNLSRNTTRSRRDPLRRLIEGSTAAMFPAQQCHDTLRCACGASVMCSICLLKHHLASVMAQLLYHLSHLRMHSCISTKCGFDLVICDE